MRRLVAAHPRSGTKYLATYLRWSGHDFVHEGYGKSGKIGWIWVGKGRIFNKTVNFIHSDYDIIFHMVRNPVDVISSMNTIGKESWEFLFQTTSYPSQESWIYQGMHTYYLWNKRIARYAHYRFKVEDFYKNEALRKHIFNLLDLEYKNVELPSDINTRKQPKLTWDDLRSVDTFMFNRIRKMAEDYDYKAP